MESESIKEIIECVTTIISIVIAVIALMQTKIQTKLSNKQNLFNERIKNYLIFNSLIELYNINKRMIEENKEDEIYFKYDFVLKCLINNAYLETMGNVIDKPLQQPEQKLFLCKIEELKNEAEKTKFIFNGKSVQYMSKFIIAYEELLMELYQYAVLLDTMKAAQEQIPKNRKICEIAEEVNEKEYREKLFGRFVNLTNTFNNLETYKVREKVEKQIRL